MRALLQEYWELTEGLTPADLKPGLKITNVHNGETFTLTGRDSDGDWEMKKGRAVGYVLEPEDLKNFDIAGKSREDSGIAGIKFEVKHPRGGVEIRAYDKGKKVGVLEVVDDGFGCWMVAWIQVNPSHRKKGIGTALYRKAATIACKRGGALCSDDASRSSLAMAVWKKGVESGHVIHSTRTQRNGIKIDFFKYKCPVKAYGS